MDQVYCLAQKYIQTNRQKNIPGPRGDPTEALESNKIQNQKLKKPGPISTNLSFFELCLRQAELKQVSFLKQTNYTNITVHFLFFFSFSFDTEGDTSNPICRVF